MYQGMTFTLRRNIQLLEEVQRMSTSRIHLLKELWQMPKNTNTTLVDENTLESLLKDAGFGQIAQSHSSA